MKYVFGKTNLTTPASYLVEDAQMALCALNMAQNCRAQFTKEKMDSLVEQLDCLYNCLSTLLAQSAPSLSASSLILPSCAEGIVRHEDGTQVLCQNGMGIDAVMAGGVCQCPKDCLFSGVCEPEHGMIRLENGMPYFIASRSNQDELATALDISPAEEDGPQDQRKTEIKAWQITFRNSHTGAIGESVVFGESEEQALETAHADCASLNGWGVISIVLFDEVQARIKIENFAKIQNGKYACPRCGKKTMDKESVSRNALSRHIEISVCDACGSEEALEDAGVDAQLPISNWAVVTEPQKFCTEDTP